jgi:chromosome segregation ATPase
VCAGGYEAKQALRAVEEQLKTQRSLIGRQESQLRTLSARIEELEEEVGLHRTMNEECVREMGVWRARAVSLEAHVAQTNRTRERVETRWPMLATLMRSAEGNAYKEPNGYRFDGPMRALVARSQLIPRAIWKAHFRASGLANMEAEDHCLLWGSG